MSDDYRVNYLLDKCADEVFRLTVIEEQFMFVGDKGTQFPIKNNLPKSITSVVNGTETYVTKDRFVLRKLREKQLSLPLSGDESNV